MHQPTNRIMNFIGLSRLIRVYADQTRSGDKLAPFQQPGKPEGNAGRVDLNAILDSQLLFQEPRYRRLRIGQGRVEGSVFASAMPDQPACVQRPDERASRVVAPDLQRAELGDPPAKVGVGGGKGCRAFRDQSSS
jgi:hypothetical protein